MSGGNLHKMKIFTISVDSTLSCGIVEKFRKTFFRSPFLGFWLRSQKRTKSGKPKKFTILSGLSHRNSYNREGEFLVSCTQKVNLISTQFTFFNGFSHRTYKRRFSKLNRTKKSGKVESFTIVQHPAFSIFIPQPFSFRTQQIET